MNANRSPVLVDGLWTGLIGYLALAVVVGLGNLVTGRSPFFTAALLGEYLFYGRTDAADLVVTPGPVFAANGIFLIGFLVIGTVLAWIAALGERIPQYWYLASLSLAFIAAKLLAFAFLIPRPVIAAIPFWLAATAAFASALAMGAYLLTSHPGIRRGAQEFQD